MFCTLCGSQIAEGQNTCSVCGAVITQQAEYNPQMQYGGQQQYNQQMQYGGQQQFNKPMYPGLAGHNMGWFQFIIWFQLFASALSMFTTGLQALTGAHYGVDYAELVYDTYDGLKTLDVFYGIVCFGLAGFALYTRFRLSGFKQNGPKCYYILNIAAVVVSIIYIILASSVTGIDVGELVVGSYITTCFVSIVMLIINYVYFSNRKHMFVNL